ncbi:unnamed protein product [Ectocarpus sp. CCAP 1310/34]|nr:unnamed protein product [Ectocarpus sp. CCAP 1310/34]
MEVDRTIEIRGEERVVRQQRKNHIRGILLISQLLRKGTTEAAGKPVQSVVADEVELLEKGREHVEGIRERASKRGKRQPAAAAAASSAAAKKAKRKGADAALSDPLALAHDGGTRSGATPETSREEAVAEERRSSAMDLMQNDPVLMERVRAMLDAGAAEQAAAKVAAIDAANTRALRASLQALKQHCNSSIGWTTYQTALAGELLIETDFIEKYRHEARVVLTCATAPTTTMMVALVHHSPDNRGEHETDAWIFLSSDPNHDFDFHHAAMEVVVAHYTTGPKSAATAGSAAPRVHMFTDGCGKQYKGKRNFRAVAQSLRRLGVRILHNFAVTSHFKGTHDGIGALMKRLLRNAEMHGTRIPDVDVAHEFLLGYAVEADKAREGHFTTWSPYRIKSFEVRKFGPKEIPRPPIDLTGIPGSSKLYFFTGTEDEQEDVQDTFSLVWATSVGVQTDDFVVGAAGDKVLTARKWVVDESRARKWAAPKKFTRSWKLRVRGASCYCSTCRIGCYGDCMVAKVYPDLVGEVMEKSGKEMVGRRTLGTQLTGVILPVISSDESPVAPTLDESMGEVGGGGEKEDEGEEEDDEGEEEEEEEGEEEGEREEAQYVSSRGRVSIAKKRFPEVG